MQYRLYCLDAVTQLIVSATDLVARDDLDALKKAERLCEAHAIEIWQGARRVARVKKDNAPLNSEDRISL
ncbi:MAG: hypothetical protein H0U98_17570 [Alphaproteobacteria bacterium]|nr:hypothetical protein [Alphaproteobacteria bacterium]